MVRSNLLVTADPGGRYPLSGILTPMFLCSFKKYFASSRILDISFNLLRNIEGIDKLTQLKKLFLVNNKISKIENLSTLHQLQMLELGSNRIRVSTDGSAVVHIGYVLG